MKAASDEHSKRLLPRTHDEGRARRARVVHAVLAAYLCLLLPAVAAAWQLPAPPLPGGWAREWADDHLRDAEYWIEQAEFWIRRMNSKLARKNFERAREYMAAAFRIHKEHGVELPVEFFFQYAEVLERVGLYDEAIEFATHYLTQTGREGVHYREALVLLDSAVAAERKSQDEERIRNPQETIARMEFVRIPAGKFRMGSKFGAFLNKYEFSDERPRTQVQISREYRLGKYEVTQAEWTAVMGTNPSYFTACGRCPVERVSWGDVQEFIAKLNDRAGMSRYRLPTEAEWEYAARAGSRKDTYAGDLPSTLGRSPVLEPIAWYGANSGDRTHPVGLKKPNAWGLHDMLGNVGEWVRDLHDDYPGGSVTDPQVDTSLYGSKVIRGGDWDDSPPRCRAAFRGQDSPGVRSSRIGFRLLRME